MDLFVPLLVAVSGVPALAIAVWHARGADTPRTRRIALHWALVALAIFLGAAGLLWAGSAEGRTTAVAVLMAVAVNAILVSLLLSLRRGDRGR